MSNFKMAGIVGVGAICVMVMCIFWIQSSGNKAITYEQTIEVAALDIHVQEKRRKDLLPNLVDAVKQYDKHEAEVLQAIVDGRSKTADIENVTTSIAAVAEAYPALKSNENYKQLMTELTTTENLISQYRSNYNLQVGSYKSYIKSFPARYFLLWTGYTPVDYDLLDYDVSAEAPTNLFKE